MPFISSANSGQLHWGPPAKALVRAPLATVRAGHGPGLGARTTIRCYYYQASLFSASDPALGVRGLEWIGRQFELDARQT